MRRQLNTLTRKESEDSQTGKTHIVIEHSAGFEDNLTWSSVALLTWSSPGRVTVLPW